MENFQINIVISTVNENSDYKYQYMATIKKSELLQLALTDNIHGKLIKLNIAKEFAKRFKEYKLEIIKI